MLSASYGVTGVMGREKHESTLFCSEDSTQGMWTTKGIQRTDITHYAQGDMKRERVKHCARFDNLHVDSISPLSGLKSWFSVFECIKGDIMRFLIEQSQTPIYRRIIDALSRAITHSMHDAIIINPSNYNSVNEFIDAIHKNNIDYCLIIGTVSALSQVLIKDKFIFEFINTKLIFIHYDSITGNYSGVMAEKRIAAYLRTRDRSTHYCLEHFNYLDLKTLGISNSFPIYHASEFMVENQHSTLHYDVSFVGHVLPSNGNIFGNHSASLLIKEDFQGRVSMLDKRIEPSSIVFANMVCPYMDFSVNWFSAKYTYIYMLHSTSLYLRGEVINQLDSYKIDIFGGDMAYIHNSARNLKIEKHGLHYHPPLDDYATARSIYASSRVNLNITSLQFDDAVINRVIDAAACGGFILTDWKSDLCKLTNVYEQISYRTIDELNDKIEYYLTNENERCEIAKQLEHDIKSNSTYQAIWMYILSKLSNTE